MKRAQVWSRVDRKSLEFSQQRVMRNRSEYGISGVRYFIVAWLRCSSLRGWQKISVFECVDNGNHVALNFLAYITGIRGLRRAGPHQLVHVIQAGFRDVYIVLIDTGRFVIAEPRGRIASIESNWPGLIKPRAHLGFLINPD